MGKDIKINFIYDSYIAGDTTVYTYEETENGKILTIEQNGNEVKLTRSMIDRIPTLADGWKIE